MITQPGEPGTRPSNIERSVPVQQTKMLLFGDNSSESKILRNFQSWINGLRIHKLCSKAWVTNQQKFPQNARCGIGSIGATTSPVSCIFTPDNQSIPSMDISKSYLGQSSPTGFGLVKIAVTCLTHKHLMLLILRSSGDQFRAEGTNPGILPARPTQWIDGPGTTKEALLELSSSVQTWHGAFNHIPQGVLR